MNILLKPEHSISSSSPNCKVSSDPLVDLRANIHLEYLQEAAEAKKRALEYFSPVAEGTVGTRYRFRAECPRDADLFLRAICKFIEPSWTMEPITYYPDVEVSFVTGKEVSPRDLLWIACTIEDGHVLVETLAKESDYTGERDYFCGIDIHDPKLKPESAVLAEMQKGATWCVESHKYLFADAKRFAANLEAISRGR